VTRDGRASRTAEGVAAVRAAEMVLQPEGGRLFADPLARDLLAGYRRRALRFPRLLRFLMALNERLYPGMATSVLVRAAYARSRLEALLAAGVRQVVILGAGLDTTAWIPDLPSDLLTWEVDQPGTQALKRRRLAEAGIAEPPGLSFLPLELETGRLSASLAASGHRRDRPTFITMLGLLPYLTRGAVETAFREASGLLQGGGEVVYTWLGAAILDRARMSAGTARLARRVARLGEPFRFGADRGEMERLVAAEGLCQVESYDGEALTAMLPAGDGRVVNRLVNLARAIPRPPS